MDSAALPPDVVPKPLDPTCLQHGRLHPAVRDRLQRIRELPLTNIAQLRGVEMINGYLTLLWDFVPGQTLASCAAHIDPTGLRRDLSHLLVALHASGLVHGAIHARNIIVSPAGRLILTHFSPLLHYDPATDQNDLATMLRELGVPTLDDSSSSIDVEQPRRWRSVLRSGSFWLAGGIAAVAALIATWIYRTNR